MLAICNAISRVTRRRLLSHTLPIAILWRSAVIDHVEEYASELTTPDALTRARCFITQVCMSDIDLAEELPLMYIV